MTEVSKHEPGTFCWTDLSTTDQKAATKFYTSLFGWKVEEYPIGEGETYTMFFIDGKEVCALHSMMEDQKKMGVPPHWLAHISVASADETAKKIQSAGGRLLAEPFDVMDVGRMSVAQDPTGAVFSIWQPRRHVGARIQEVPGSVCWRELMTQERDKAAKFYTSVFGWNFDSETFAKMNYTLIKRGEEGVGGVITVPGVPNHWLTYWIVENCEESARKVEKLGGRVMKEPTKIPNVGTFAVLLDPQGAAFAIMQGEA